MTDWPINSSAPPDRLGTAFLPVRVMAYLAVSAMLLDLLLSWGEHAG